jgi:hypothetical protein
MSSSVGSFVCGLRNFLDQGFRSLPTILANCILLLGLIQANLTYLFFFIGLFIAAPLASFGLNMGLSMLYNKFLTNYISPDLFYLATGGAEQCQMFPVFPIPALGGSSFVVPSYWVTIISFFFFYLFYNAYNVYNYESEKGASQEGIKRRKFRTGSSMFVLPLIYIIIMILRYSVSNCETPLGMIIGAGLGSFISYWWYIWMKSCGLGNYDDIFGIQTQILPENQKN